MNSMSATARNNMRLHEKVVLKYYDDGGPGKGHCTWGIGTLAHRGPCTAEELATEVTEEAVEAAFAERVRDAELAVARNVRVKLTQAQFDALVSLTYNCGPSGASRVYKLVNAEKFNEAADEISGMVYGRIKLKGKTVKVRYRGLVRRREAESAPFREVAKTEQESAAK